MKKRADISEARKSAAEEQVKLRQQEIKYDVRDFTVDYLINEFHNGLFFIPEYQRQFIWRDKDRSLFIESVLLGLPIPMLFVADLEDGRLEVVDGAQRLATLEQFLSDDLVLSGLPILDSLNGFRFTDLPVSQQRKLRTRALRVIALEDVTSTEIRQEIFHRINRRGEKARGTEIRRGALAGPFITFISEKARDRAFRRLCPIGEQLLRRREDEELVARFFAYSDTYLAFKHDVDNFVDRYVAAHRDAFDQARLSSEFASVMTFVGRYFPYGFAKSRTAKSTPRVRFEAIAVGTNLALRINPALVPPPVSEWIETDEFKQQTTTHASNSGPRLRSRIEFVRDRLLG